MKASRILPKLTITPAHSLTGGSGRKIGLQRITKLIPDCSIILVTRDEGNGNTVPCFIVGSYEEDFNIKPGTTGSCTLNTLNKNKSREVAIKVEQTLRIKNKRMTHLDGWEVSHYNKEGILPELELRSTWKVINPQT